MSVAASQAQRKIVTRRAVMPIQVRTRIIA